MRFHLGIVVLAAMAALRPLPAFAAGDVVILDYHSFLDSRNSSIDFSKDELAAQLDKLSAMGFSFATARDAIAGAVEGRANIVITIDDGNHSVYEAFYEVFKPRGIRPLLFVYPAIIGRVRYALTVERLRELLSEGCELGAHGYHHEYLSAAAFARNAEACLLEISKPGPALKQMLGMTPVFFAYPFGLGSPQAERALKKAGYQWAFTAGDTIRPLRFDDQNLDRFAVPRTIVYRWNKDKIFAALEQYLKADSSSSTMTNPKSAGVLP